MKIRARHDALFKFTFSDPQRAAEIVAAVLPPQLCALIDFSTFELMPGSFVDIELSQRHTDLLFQAKLRGGGDIGIHILLEHQSTEHRAMALRMIGYQTRIWQQILKAQPDAMLPPIVPIVIYHGRMPWSGPRALNDLYDPRIDLEAFGPLMPSAAFIIDDLTALSDDALRSRALTGLVHLALGSFKHCRDAGALREWMQSSGKAMMAAWSAPDGRQALEALIRYILMVNDLANWTVTETVGELLGEEAQEVAMTTAQRLFDAGLLKGREEGIEQGIEQGIEEGQEAERRAAALTLLTKRFGTLDPAEQARFDALAVGALVVIYEEIFTADSLDAMLALVEAHSA